MHDLLPMVRVCANERPWPVVRYRDLRSPEVSWPLLNAHGDALLLFPGRPQCDSIRQKKSMEVARSVTDPVRPSRASFRWCPTSSFRERAGQFHADGLAVARKAAARRGRIAAASGAGNTRVAPH